MKAVRQCCARGCKRHVYMDGNFKRPLLCYKHGWWYACTEQHKYAFLCTVVFPLWSAGDIAVYLEWIGL